MLVEDRMEAVLKIEREANDQEPTIEMIQAKLAEKRYCLWN